MEDFEEKYMKPLATVGTVSLFLLATFIAVAVGAWVLSNYFLAVTCLSSCVVGLLAGFALGGRVYRR